MNWKQFLNLFLFSSQLFLFFACSNKKEEWITFANDKKFYGITEKNTDFKWSGSYVDNIINGPGTLTRIEKGDVISTLKVEARMGCIDSASLKKTKQNELFLGKLDDEEPDGFGVLFKDSLAIVGVFNGYKSKDAVNVYSGDKLLYRGGWKKGFFHGNGKLWLQNGDFYEGNFKKGKFDGKGTLTRMAGEVLKRKWQNGELDERMSALYAYLENHQNQLEANTYNRLTERIYNYETGHILSYSLIIFLALCTLLLPLGIFVRNKKTHRSSPLKTEELYLYSVLGGILGIHKAKTLNLIFILYWSLFFLLVLFNLQNINLYIFHPDVWGILPVFSTATQITVLILGILLIMDFIIVIPYDRYHFNALYFRKDSRELDILQGRQTDIEKFYQNLASNIRKIEEKNQRNLAKLKRVNGEKCKMGKVRNFFGGLIGDGRLEFEQDKLKEMQKTYQNMVENSESLKKYNDTLGDFLKESRIAAYRNLYLAKELIDIISYSKKNKQFIVKDLLDTIDLPEQQLNLLKTTQPITFDFEGCLKNISKNYAQISKPGSGGKTGAIIMSIKDIGGSLLDNWSARIGAEEKVINCQANIVSNAKTVTERIVILEGEMLRYSEILASLFNANKAFIKAYADLRDIVYGEPSFLNFLKRIKRSDEKFKNLEFKTSMQHLVLVCNEYNRINKAKK